jgi:DNA-binding LacI/PurR family transcriptional regulator
LVAAVTQEILNKNETAAFPIASEHQLCRRFNVSRVTVRLALSDLENRGLIYRKHGKGTFAHGSSTRVHRHLGILMKTSHSIQHRPIVELVQGAQKEMATHEAGVLLISSSPDQWRPEKASSLGGVIVIPWGVTPHDLEVLKNRNLPYLIFAESDLPGPHVHLGQKEAARKMTEELLRQGHRNIALLTGYDICLDTPKRLGVHEAFCAAGIDPAKVIEISIDLDESKIYDAALQVLHMRPRPTAVIAFDYSMGSMTRFHAMRKENLRVPEDLSIVSFHDWPFLSHVEPVMTTVHFDFFKAGQCAARALSQAALTGEMPTDIHFEPAYPAGQTVGPVPAGA